MVIETKVMIGWFKLQLWMWLVDLNYDYECDWHNKLSDNNLASRKYEFQPITIEENVIFMMMMMIIIIIKFY